MMNEPKKKPYEPPKIYKVELNQDQAILAGCSSATTTASGTGSTRCNNTCRRTSSTSGDSAAPAS